MWFLLRNDHLPPAASAPASPPLAPPAVPLTQRRRRPYPHQRSLLASAPASPPPGPPAVPPLPGHPRDLHEAAALDGAAAEAYLVATSRCSAGPPRWWWCAGHRVAQISDQSYLITAGGPSCATRSGIEFIYDTGFTSQRVGYAWRRRWPCSRSS